MSNTPTIQEKNIEIARMLGWTYITWMDKRDKVYGETISPGWWSTIPKIHNRKVNSHLHKAANHNRLNFDSDANRQFEAIDWIEKQGYDTSIHGDNNSSIQNCYISTGTAQGDGGHYFTTHVDEQGKTKKEAIFKALYAFALYIKLQK